MMGNSYQLNYGILLHHKEVYSNQTKLKFNHLLQKLFFDDNLWAKYLF